jgi:hypothetical protein
MLERENAFSYSLEQPDDPISRFIASGGNTRRRLTLRRVAATNAEHARARICRKYRSWLTLLELYGLADHQVPSCSISEMLQDESLIRVPRACIGHLAVEPPGRRFSWRQLIHWWLARAVVATARPNRHRYDDLSLEYLADGPSQLGVVLADGLRGDASPSLMLVAVLEAEAHFCRNTPNRRLLTDIYTCPLELHRFLVDWQDTLLQFPPNCDRSIPCQAAVEENLRSRHHRALVYIETLVRMDLGADLVCCERAIAAHDDLLALHIFAGPLAALAAHIAHNLQADQIDTLSVVALLPAPPAVTHEKPRPKRDRPPKVSTYVKQQVGVPASQLTLHVTTDPATSREHYKQSAVPSPPADKPVKPTTCGIDDDSLSRAQKTALEALSLYHNPDPYTRLVRAMRVSPNEHGLRGPFPPEWLGPEKSVYNAITLELQGVGVYHDGDHWRVAHNTGLDPRPYRLWNWSPFSAATHTVEISHDVIFSSEDPRPAHTRALSAHCGPTIICTVTLVPIPSLLNFLEYCSPPIVLEANLHLLSDLGTAGPIESETLRAKRAVTNRSYTSPVDPGSLLSRTTIEVAMLRQSLNNIDPNARAPTGCRFMVILLIVSVLLLISRPTPPWSYVLPKAGLESKNPSASSGNATRMSTAITYHQSTPSPTYVVHTTSYTLPSNVTVAALPTPSRASRVSIHAKRLDISSDLRIEFATLSLCSVVTVLWMLRKLSKRGCSKPTTLNQSLLGINAISSSRVTCPAPTSTQEASRSLKDTQ